MSCPYAPQRSESPASAGNNANPASPKKELTREIALLEAELAKRNAEFEDLQDVAAQDIAAMLSEYERVGGVVEDDQVGGAVEDGGTSPLDHDADGAVVEDGGAAGTLPLPASGRGGEEGVEEAVALPSSGRAGAPGIHGGSLGEDGGGDRGSLGEDGGGGENGAATRAPPAGAPADHVHASAGNATNGASATMNPRADENVSSRTASPASGPTPASGPIAFPVLEDAGRGRANGLEEPSGDQHGDQRGEDQRGNQRDCSEPVSLLPPSGGLSQEGAGPRTEGGTTISPQSRAKSRISLPKA